MIVVPDTSVPVVTKSLQLEPANFVSTQARLRKSHIFNVRSWLPVTTFDGSPKNLAAITFPLCPVNVCCKLKENHIASLIYFCLPLRSVFHSVFLFILFNFFSEENILGKISIDIEMKIGQVSWGLSLICVSFGSRFQMQTINFSDAQFRLIC